MGELTNELADELAVYNIQANCLYPGWIDTPLSRKMVENRELSDRIVSAIPAGRWGRPQDFKEVAVLLSSSAGGYITGSRIWADGGTHSMSSSEYRGYIALGWYNWANFANFAALMNGASAFSSSEVKPSLTASTGK
ncbi:hypothetical protein GGS23DRAFT_600946 [Durotheca rogersii]|uniref:uncharacterized protein n=1 Tax=Durotheca rogersii TaxID=419775 RepID=UPI00221FB8E8|nr:uncharacterized protein GGS23DRAFT_600946 [Durotheca rogersii]KAI5857330.1 hypothetical protein GGS23DRAFT_600946 [Durotheca rogersii]